MSDDLSSIFSALVSDLGLSAIGVVTLFGLALLLSCFVKIVTVLSMLRVGLGVGSVPGAFVVGGLALVLSFFIMAPELDRSAGSIRDALRAKGAAATDRDRAAALDAGIAQWREFASRYTDQKELARFAALAERIDARSGSARSGSGDTERGAAVPTAEAAHARSKEWRVIGPAFLVSELRRAFSTGLRIFLPFLVVELLVAVVLASLGLERVNPTLVSFPFKVMLFVAVDGWSAVTQGIITSYI